MSRTTIKFGTDGWRGVIAEDFTFENVRRVAQAAADYWKGQGGNGGVMVGYDRRFMSETFARVVCEVLAGNGLKTLCAPTAVPTPAVSFAVRDRRLRGAVMITASHNPPMFNGFKLKADHGGPAEPERCAAVEKLVDASPVRQVAFHGNVEVYDPRPAHLRAIRRFVDGKTIRSARLRIVVDAMHGCGDGLLEELLGDGVITIRAERHPLFGGMNPEPIAANLGPLCAAVKRHRAHVGLATDGDADRVGVVDDRGRYVSIQLVFALLLLHLLRNRGERGAVVVRSANCTTMIDRICQAHGVEVVEVPVGFKYICQQMRQRDVLIGGEESGGIGFRGHIPERDGLLANLMLAELLAVSRKRLSELTAAIQAEFGRSVYDRIDMAYPLEKRGRLIDELKQNPPAELVGVRTEQVNTLDGVKYVARDGSWLMFRTSGTEPIIRIYSEAGSARRVRALLEYGRQRALALQ